MDNQNTYCWALPALAFWRVLILVLMDNQNTNAGTPALNETSS